MSSLRWSMHSRARGVLIAAALFGGLACSGTAFTIDSGVCVAADGGACGPLSDASGDDAGDATNDAAQGDDARCAPLPCPSNAPWDPTRCACAAPDAGVSCVSTQGGACGGNKAHACTCETDLVCTPRDGGAPSGDVGGTCEPRSAACDPPGTCPQGTAWDTVGCACASPCQTAADCHGALPALCAQCASADGGMAPITGCAHFVCRGGFCETSVCN